MSATLEKPAREATPAQDSEVNGPRTLRCFVYRQSDYVFVAECIDLDIMVKSKTAELAKENLVNALLGYVQTVIEMGEESLLMRPSPLSRRIRFRLFCLKAAISRDHDNFLLFDWSPKPRRTIA